MYIRNIFSLINDDNTLGYKSRRPYESEKQYFKQNKNVGGMATEENKSILNPYNNLSNREKKFVKSNEALRLYNRNNVNSLNRDWDLTNKQYEYFRNYSPNIKDIKDTIISRIITQDPSALDYTDKQKNSALELLNTILTDYPKFGKGLFR